MPQYHDPCPPVHPNHRVTLTAGHSYTTSEVSMLTVRPPPRTVPAELSWLSPQQLSDPIKSSIPWSVYSPSFTNPDPGPPFPSRPAWTPQPSTSSMIVPLHCCVHLPKLPPWLHPTELLLCTASGLRSMARENTHNSLGRFCFIFKSTDKWTASALPSDTATASSHPASLQDTLCPFSSLLQLFCPFPAWLSADDLIFPFRGRMASEGSFLTTELTDLRIHTCLLCPLSCCKFPVIPETVSWPRSLLKPWTAFFLTYSSVYVCVCVSCSVVSDSLQPHGP